MWQAEICGGDDKGKGRQSERLRGGRGDGEERRKGKVERKQGAEKKRRRRAF